jgi:hypothetical protein
MNNRELDNELRRWGDSHSPKEEQLTELQRRILAEAGAPLPAIRFERREASWLGRVAWALAGAALAMVLMHLARRPHQPLPQQAQAPARDGALALAQSAAVPAAQVDELFMETRRLFPQRLRWVADTDQDFVVNVADGMEPDQVAHRQATNIALVAMTRRPGEKWEILWRSVVVTRDDDRVTVPVPGGKVVLRARATRSGGTVVDTQLVLPEVSTSSSHALRPRYPEPLVSLQTPEKELRIYQMATPLALSPQA